MATPSSASILHRKYICNTLNFDYPHFHSSEPVPVGLFYNLSNDNFTKYKFNLGEYSYYS